MMNENQINLGGGLLINCEDCKKRKTCKRLCQEAVEYVNQDNKGRREALVDEIDGSRPGPWPEIGHDEAVCQLYFLDRKQPAEIADIVMISRRQVDRIIKKYKAIIKQNLQKRA
jgi:hypothetical protein